MSLSEIPEMRELLSWLGKPPRSPRQLNRLNESDCELVALDAGGYLATTVDSVSEEISAGLYKDPFTLGWITATASLSDLAAVGAAPIGMLLSAQWGPDMDTEKKSEVARGFSAALTASGTYWLGGDSGAAASTVLTGVGLGTCDSRPLTRVGMRPGEILCHTGTFGAGAALALRFLRGEPESDFAEGLFRPRARIDAGLALRGLASAAMDTSDGLLSTLDTLNILNGSGMELDWIPGLLSEPAVSYCHARELPLWTLWMAEHGEFQLVVSIPPENLKKAKDVVKELTPFGRVTASPEVTLGLPDGTRRALDLSFARNLLSGAGTDLRKALSELIGYARKMELP